LADSHFETSKFFTSPAMRTGKCEASKRVISAMPDRPSTMFGQDSVTPMPTGDTIPRPVTATRRGEVWEKGTKEIRTDWRESLATSRRRRGVAAP